MRSHPDMPLAIVSDCERYRYLLSRRLGSSEQVVTVIGLNPSTADATQDDPTIRRCIGFAKREGAGLLLMVNLFALRSTDPKALRTHTKPVGPDNDIWLARAVDLADLTIAAWGNGGTLLGRSQEMTEKYREKLYTLGLTLSGMPRHPLYLKSDALITPYRP